MTQRLICDGTHEDGAGRFFVDGQLVAIVPAQGDAQKQRHICSAVEEALERWMARPMAKMPREGKAR